MFTRVSDCLIKMFGVMTKSSVTVSVAMCTYNGERYIKEQLNSILRQTYHIDEIVVVDDCSQDNTLSILNEYASNYPAIKVLRNVVNKGFMYSFQRAIWSTNYDFVALSDQDDIWADNHIEVLIKAIGDRVLAVGNSLLVDAEGHSMNTTIYDVRDNLYIPSSDVDKAYRIVYSKNPYSGCNMVVQRQWLLSILPFPEDAPFQLYHDIYISMFACLTGGMAVTKDVVNLYRQHPNQVTRNVKIPIYKELCCRNHFSFWPDRLIYMNAIAKSNLIKPKAALAFINEFNKYVEFENAGNRFKTLKIRNKHYKEIYSTKFYKYYLLRSLHFLLSK